ncbi:MAG: DUF4302 domain-containing protein [Prevotellaceae bacterium]|jgi:hypothetical protein|nr:DUF4302 domain-containing protein [Prevotellaceae bacterium]
MKKIIIYLLLPFLLLSCAKEDDRLFPDSAADRMEQRIKDNLATLQNAANGWIMTLYPSDQQLYGGYTLFVKFQDDGRVTVASELKTTSDPETITSLYTVFPEAGPVLSFDSYNSFIHYFSEPRNPNGPVELGMGGDYEFMIMDAAPYETVLKGKKTGNKILLTPIAAGENWNTLMQQYVNAAGKMDFLQGEGNIGGIDVIVQKGDARTLNFYYSGNKVQEIPYHYTPDGLVFYKPLKLGGVEINALLYVDDPDEPCLLDAGDTDTQIIITMK